MTKRLIAVFVIAACSGDATDTPCARDGDCAGGSVCELRDGDAVCVAATEATLVIGQSAALTGVRQGQGRAVQQGVELAFAEQNATGGVRGRALELHFVDDAFVPDVAEDAVRTLIDARDTAAAPSCPSTVGDTAIERGPGAVLAMLGSVGAPTSLRAAAIAIETGTLYFGAITGTPALLRDTQAGPCARNLFNVRASYAEEARATLELFQAKGVASFTHIISFDQDDSFGQDGYDGLVAAYRDAVGPFPGNVDPTTPIARFRSTRNDDASVPAQAQAAEAHLAQLLGAQAGPVVVGVMMTNTYGAAAEFITALRRWQFQDDAQQATLQKATRLQLVFSSVSFVDPNPLADRLVAAGTVQTPAGPAPFTQTVYVSQVVPNYATDPSPIAAAYRSGVQARSYLSFEGYVTARVFLAGLVAHDGPFSPDALAATFEQQTALDVGLPGMFGFGADRHQYSSSVWGVAVEPDGSFRDAYAWRAGTPIELLE